MSSKRSWATLQQLDGEGNGTFRPEHPDLIRKGLLGSTLNVRGAKNTNQLQHVAMERIPPEDSGLVRLRCHSWLPHHLSNSVGRS